MKALRLLGSCLAVAVGGALTWQPHAGAQPMNPAPEEASPLPPSPLAETLQGQAKSEYESARLLFDSGDYPRALLMFQSAYRVAPDPRLLWDEAACERNLHHYVKATNLVRQFLDSHSPLVTPEAASNARAFLAAAEPLTAPLEVESNEPNAEVYLDDEPLGVPRVASAARVDLGPHKIVVKERGFEPYVETFTVTGSAQVHVTATLRPLTVPMPVAAPKPRRDETARRTRPSALPTWGWIASGGVVLAGLATASYFIFKPASAPQQVQGSIDTLRF